MRKVLFLMLFLLVLGAASISAQVRIGGDGEPNAAAVLDLNTDDSDTPTENKGALALPRVNLDDNTAQLNGTDPIAGMLVYNTNTTLGEGVYFWDGSKWVAIGGDGVVVNAVTDATAGGGLVRSGSGTAGDPYTLAIATGAVTSSMILDGSVATSDLSDGAVTRDKLAVTIHDVAVPTLGSAQGSWIYLTFPSGCTAQNAVPAGTSNYHAHCAITRSGSLYAWRAVTASGSGETCRIWCFH